MPPVGDEKEVFHVGGDHRALLVGARVDRFAGVCGRGPAAVFLAAADVDVGSAEAVDQRLSYLPQLATIKIPGC